MFMAQPLQTKTKHYASYNVIYVLSLLLLNNSTVNTDWGPEGVLVSHLLPWEKVYTEPVQEMAEVQLRVEEAESLRD